MFYLFKDNFPRQLIGGAGLLELQKETAQVTHTLRRVDVWLSPPREEMAMHSRYLCPTSLSLSLHLV